MTREEFALLVEAAMQEIPDVFCKYLENVEVLIEDEPSSEQLEEFGLSVRRDTLFGLYEGIPLSERFGDGYLQLPDRITIFFRPLVRTFRTPSAIKREVRKTVIHEIGHFFGLDDDEIEREGY